MTGKSRTHKEIEDAEAREKDLSLIRHIFRVKEFLGAFEKYGDSGVTNSIWRLVFMAEAGVQAFNLGEVPGIAATHRLYDCGYEHARYLELCKIAREEQEMHDEFKTDDS